jgi:hypothetical protein
MLIDEAGRILLGEVTLQRSETLAPRPPTPPGCGT